MPARSEVLAIDFGTSNSAAGYLDGGAPRLVDMAPGRRTIPTAFFFDFDSRRTLIGDPAIAALLDGAEGRFMRALKRVLGTSLMHEERQILNEKVTFVDIIARFLAELKNRAEAQAGRRFDRVISGRPVHFHGAGDGREAQAEADLAACYRAAGFGEVSFMAEPEAAALACEAPAREGEIGLIVDIGGGTSDFSLFRASANGAEIVASHGVRVGGADFDRSISIATIMPLLGRGSLLNREMGAGATPAPNAIFNDLATWELIPFLYTPQIRRQAAEMRRLAQAPHLLSRLVTVLEAEMGHDLAFAAERGKIAANAGEADARIALDMVEDGLSAPLTADALRRALHPHETALRAGADETLRLAGLKAEDVARVVFVGGSSLMTMVTGAMTALFPGARRDMSEVFTAVADGLALASAQK